MGEMFYYIINIEKEDMKITPSLIRYPLYLKSFTLIFLLNPIFNTNPTAIIELTKEVSPELINGSGNPVFGRTLVATPTFTKT